MLSERERHKRYLAGYESDDPEEYRTPFEKDRDRVLYSPMFRRLGSVTQVASSAEVHLLHTRLTHSEKVAQVGRRLTQYLKKHFPQELVNLGLDPDLTEAAGLAHDLGHPPFGHAAERELNSLMCPFGGFEGNAQTFRIVTKIGFKKPSRRPPPAAETRAQLPGFDLTRASLASILKYPAAPGESLPTGASLPDRSAATKIGVYPSEKAIYTFAREGEIPGVLAPTAILMDWADDISYAVHDIEDHVRVGLIPFFRIRHDQGQDVIRRAEDRMRSKDIAYDETEFSVALQNVIKDAEPLWDYRGTLSDDYKLQDWVSTRITAFERAVELVATPPYVTIDPGAAYQIELLKAITWEYIIDAPPLAAAQEGQCALVRHLFTGLCGWLSERRPTVPKRLLEMHALILDEESRYRPAGVSEDDYAIHRAVCDYVVMLTEPQAIDLFQRISGVSPATIFGGWL